jgi:hypothetical protein
MSIDPKKIDPKTTSPKPKDPAQATPPETQGGLDDQVFDLLEIEGIQLEPVDEATPGSKSQLPVDSPEIALPAPGASVSFDIPNPSDDPGSLTVGISLTDLPDLSGIHESTGLSRLIPTADPASGHIPDANADPASEVPLIPMATPGSSVAMSSASDSSASIGNLEPVAPVAPASGWLDSEPTSSSEYVGTAPLAEPLEVHQSDFLDAPPAVESSDIFSSGPIPAALGTDQSDVIAATAFIPPASDASDKSARPSEIALSFDLPPGGSTIESSILSGELPVADEVPMSSESLFDSAKLAATPPLPDPKSSRHDEADYGSTPLATPDASSILADLSDPGEITFDESSSVRLEAPGVRRTLSSNPGEGTEFDLTISDDPVAPELDAAAEDSENAATDWREQSGSDLFSDGRSATEFDLEVGNVDPIDSRLTPEQPSLTSAPSSIFSSDKIPGATGSKSGPSSDSVRIGRPTEDEDAAVEFSDHPTADLESSSAALAGPMTPDKKSKQPGGKVDFDTPKKTTPKLSAKADADQDSGKVDWGMASVEDSDEATIGFPHALLDAPVSGILKRGGKAEEPSAEMPTRNEATLEKSKAAKSDKGKGSKTKPPAKEGTDPSVEIDWMAGSSSEEPAISPEAYAERPSTTPSDQDKKQAPRDKKRPVAAREAEVGGKKKGGGWIGGTLLGMVIAGGACAGLYYGGVVPGPETKPAKGEQKSTQTSQVQVAAPATLADAKSAIDGGDHAKALKLLDDIKTPEGEKRSVETLAAIGQARLFARIQELGKTNAATADGGDPELTKAREELKAVVDDAGAAKSPEGEKAAVKSAIHLGLTYELAGDRSKAKEVYEEGLKKFPKFAATFQAAIDRLAATAPGGDNTSLRPAPADIEQLLFVTVLLQADASGKEEEEAGVYFWKAVNLAKAEKYGEAVDEIKKAKVAHIKQAKAMAGRGLNPLSDPLEQIFPRCCDDLKAYWELRSAVYTNKSIAEQIKKDGLEKTMSELGAAHKKASEAVKLMSELKDAVDKLAKADKDLKNAQDKLVAEQKIRIDNETKTKDELAKAESNVLKAEGERKKTEEVLASLAKELQTAKLLTEKYDTAALLAAQKTAVDRATGPTLSALIPPGMMAISGSLSAAHLIDISERLTKSETAIKKLTAEKTQLTAEYAAEIKKIKEVHTEDVKKLTDGFAAEMKKVMDTNSTNTAKLKEEQTAELKKMTDKFAVDLKKLTEENAVAVKKVADGFDGKIKALEAAVAKEKAVGEDMAAKLRIDMKNAISPAQSLDLWLPLLSELRRTSDAAPALAIAGKVLATANPDSEDAAKARTVSGMALLLKGDLNSAKLMFDAARSSPAYAAAKGREWVRVADVGLASITDPLAAYRLPVEKPRRDLKAAAQYLDQGINTYKAGRYSDAIPILVDATKADPTDPLAWYFLGAARWATGSKDQAKEDYRQGGEWEKLSTMSARTISDNLEPIQGLARDALWVARP